MLSVSGDIALMPVGDVIAWIANRKMSCSLSLRRGHNTSGFVIRGGLVFQASSSDPREYLGQHLINFGYIDEDQLQKAFETQQETHVPLGRVLVMIDAVSTEQLARVLLFKTRESLLEAMCWNDGTFKLASDVPQERDLDAEVPIDLKEVHSEGQARGQMWREIRKIFPSDATRCDVLVGESDVVLSGFDRKLLELLSQGLSIGETSLELRSMDFQIYARLYDLYNRQMIRPRLQVGVFDELATADAPEIALDDIEAIEEPAPPPAARPTPMRGTSRSVTVDPPRATPIGGTPRPAAPKPTAKPAPPKAGDDDEVGRYRMRAAPAQEAPGVAVPAEAKNPEERLRIALAGRNWNEVMVFAERILEVDPQNAEVIAAKRVAEAQLKKLPAAERSATIDTNQVPDLAVPRAQLAKAHLSSKERYVLSRIDGRRTLQQIAAVSPIQRDELLRIVEAFVARGTLTLR